MAQKYNPLEDLRALGGPEEASRILSALINAAAETAIPVGDSGASVEGFYNEHHIQLSLNPRQLPIVKNLFHLQPIGPEEQVVSFGIKKGLRNELTEFLQAASASISEVGIRTPRELKDLSAYCIFVAGRNLATPLTAAQACQHVAECCELTPQEGSSFSRLVLSERGIEVLRAAEARSSSSNSILTPDINDSESTLGLLIAKYNPNIILRRVEPTDVPVVDDSSARIDSPLVTGMTITAGPEDRCFSVGAVAIYVDQLEIRKNNFQNLLLAELIEVEIADRILSQINAEGPMGTYFYTLLQDQLQVVKFLARCRQLDLCRDSLEEAGLEQLRLEAFRAGYHFCSNMDILDGFTDNDHPIIGELKFYAKQFQEALKSGYSGPGAASLTNKFKDLALTDEEESDSADEDPRLPVFLESIFSKYRNLIKDAQSIGGQKVHILSS